VSDNPLLNNVGLSSQANIDFPDPFLDMASLAMPRSLHDVLDMCEKIWLKNGTYRMAAQRIVRYFITNIEFERIDDEKRKELMAFLNTKLHVVEQLMLIGDDFLGYGNSFSSIVLPFRRFLRCPKCGQQRPIEKSNWKFQNWKFVGRCANCGEDVEYQRIDRRSAESDRIKVKRWAPQEFRLQWHPYSQDYRYFWRIPTYFSTEIKKGNPFFVEHTPWELIDTIKKNQIFKFNPGVIYHMREETLSGVRTGGWGVSRLLSNFAQAWYTQVLHRANEAIAQDYVVPFRTVTPGPRPGASQADPLINMNVPGFTQKVMNMIKEHRKDPASWHALPFPIAYQALGGEAKELVTPEMLDQGLDTLLNGIGIPAELYRGTLQFQAMPTALRLFQQTWPQLVAQLNGWLEWAIEIICTSQKWDQPEKVFLQPVTMADDIERRQIWLQLASANMISKKTAFSPWNINAPEEQRKIFEEQKLFDKLQSEFQEDTEQSQMNNDVMRGMQPGQQGGGMMGGGVDPSQAGAAMTPQDLTAQAEEIAAQLLAIPSDKDRRTELVNIKHSNPTLHAQVKQMMTDMRGQAASQGQQMILQQQQQGM